MIPPQEKQSTMLLQGKGVNYHGAPLAIIVCGDHSDVFVRPFDKKDMVSVDATIVADHIVLEAEDLDRYGE